MLDLKSSCFTSFPFTEVSISYLAQSFPQLVCCVTTNIELVLPSSVKYEYYI